MAICNKYDSIQKKPPKFFQGAPTADKYLYKSDQIQGQLKKKSVALLYTNDKITKNAIRKIIPFTVATNNIKYLGVTVKKQSLYDKNFTSLKKKLEKLSEDVKNPHAHESVGLTK